MSELTTAISVQIDKKDKEQASIILDKLGVSMSGLINMTIKQLIMQKRIPFDISIPNEDGYLYKFFTEEELIRTAQELTDMEKNPDKYKSYKNMEDLKSSLLSEKYSKEFKKAIKKLIKQPFGCFFLLSTSQKTYQYYRNNMDYTVYCNYSGVFIWMN